ncbi:peptidoglycan DD-metalloendopeptidase family protein [Amphritea sp. 1_MG-2023]|uniref:peptidoglycan DD-metalloendopeptidase family protein n=1 Tax=Amphritea sp. 1_MG-2023 TaxID=3062670 RepID=UPI0026E1C2AD|nr:peptidoglycan DD-metalloendopeptidase family protein [Amphritea sp. 1_MG-2023]MDO6562627.1 peptidoglycan DD-metalloendopeptidase family protein [Amphritea sp. 1_MG-2023]
MVRAPVDTFSAIILSIVVLMVSACSSTSRYTPIDERSIGGRHTVKVVSSQVPDQYRVRRGDTLYSIAFRYGLDFRQLARTNHINDRYDIYPGQTLLLKPTALAATTSAALKPVKKSTPVSVTQRPKSSPEKKLVAEKKVVPAKKVATASAPLKASTPPSRVTSVNPSKRELSWRWPASGQVIQRFSNKGKINKGINFAGRKGEPVYAAESGKVVYAGSGLLGYGNLVIIHHNQKYLSAYAHNSRILVKESDMVKIGDKIAEIGNSGAARTMLHFEIRRDGQPVDPMLYLPRKR